jgi:hypothetical protein
MLILTRSPGQTLRIGDDTFIDVEAVGPGQVKLRVRSARDTPVAAAPSTPPKRPILRLKHRRRQ